MFGALSVQASASQQQQHPRHPSHGGEPGAGSAGPGSTCPSSSQYTIPSSDSSSVQVPMRTTFSLLPEDNPFQDISIGSLLGWGSYGRVHRGVLDSCPMSLV